MTMNFIVSVLCVAQLVEAKLPQFLFMGQSNMVGKVKLSRFFKTMELLLAKESDDQIHYNLVNFLQTANSTTPTPLSTSSFEATQLLRMRKEKLITKSFSRPLPNITCSFYNLKRDIDYNPSEVNGFVAADKVMISPRAKCGKDIGPEFMFGHSLKHKFQVSRLRIIKIASSGSYIRTNWSKQNGKFWNEILDIISQTAEDQLQQWKGIVWFQGENDSYSQKNAYAYFDELRNFIDDLRQALGGHNQTTSMIPVVIVGLGCFITQLRYGPVVIESQQNVSVTPPNNINNTRWIPTHDLACDLHYDEASQIIIGERIAEAMWELSLMNPSPSETTSPIPTTIYPMANPAASQPFLEPIIIPVSNPLNYTTFQPTIEGTTINQSTAKPSFPGPSQQPTSRQSTKQPSLVPNTRKPTNQLKTSPPSLQPKSPRQPTIQSTVQPTIPSTTQPTTQPTTQSTRSPTIQPTLPPDRSTSTQPTLKPTRSSTMKSTSQPSSARALQPTSQPLSSHTTQPSNSLTIVFPTIQPTTSPTKSPKLQRTIQPTNLPTTMPTLAQLSIHPTTAPTKKPKSTIQPMVQPTTSPAANQPTTVPTKNMKQQVLTQYPTGLLVATPSTKPMSNVQKRSIDYFLLQGLI
jgi:Carbohydrate esterase, sialic acid-specific acetylesterase